MYDFGEPIYGDTAVIEHFIRIGVIPLILAVVAFIIHIAFAVAVFKDASARRAGEQHLWFVSPIFWAGSVLIGSVFAAALYWVMHYSTLASEKRPPVEPPGEL